MRGGLRRHRQGDSQTGEVMKKAKATLANLTGLNALRLAKEPEAEPEKIARRMPTKKATKAKKAPPVETVAVEEQPRPVGRPKTGKRSNEDFRNVTVYIRKQTHADVDDILRKRRRLDLIPPGEPQDVSELVESLLSDWLSGQSEK